MAQLLWNQKKKKLPLFLKPIARLHGTKGFLTINTDSKTHGTNTSHGMDVSRGVRIPCDEGRLTEAPHVSRVMDSRCVRADSSTYASLLKVCVNQKALREGKLIHAHMIYTGFNPDIFLGNTLVTMYAKCGSLADARRYLDEMPKTNVVSWTAMIAAYVRYGCDEKALTLFYQMQRAGIQPNQFTFASVLPACANLAALEHGKEIHEDLSRSGFQSDVFVESALVDMYAKCGSIHDAHHVFDKMSERNVVSWNAMIAGYAQNGYVDKALELFQKMHERNVVSWTSMLAGYGQNGHVDEALKLFQKMPDRNVVSWNAMIAGYVQNGYSNEALNLFRQMQLIGVNPIPVTLTTVLPACANLAALKNGKEIHENIMRNGFHFHIFVGSALVDMYAKCGTIRDACQVFDKMPEKDVISWTAMIVGYAMHGYGKEALQLFELMQDSGMRPNHITFLGVLSACCHAGLVDDGWQYFERMSRDYCIAPTVEHYCCMVDLLGRAGRLDEAQDFINKMPLKPHAAVWGCLLAACRSHANIDLGERVAEQLFKLEPENAANYVLLSNTYAAAGIWDNVEKVRKMMKDRGIKKNSRKQLD